MNDALGRSPLSRRRWLGNTLGLVAAGPASLAWGSQKRMSLTPGNHEHTLRHGGQDRRYVVYVPHGYDGSRPLPVVLAFHGGMSRAEMQQRQSRMDRVADRHQFLTVYPDGSGRAYIRGQKILTFNAGTCCGYSLKANIDDVGFTAAMLDALPRQYPVDEERVYSTGMSNGAMLTYRLACELSERLAAIGPVAGDMGVSGPAPQRPVPVIHFHGLQDQNAPYHGGKGTNQIQPNPHRAIPETVQFWVKFNHCEPKPVEVVRERDFVRETWSPAAGTDGAPVVLYTLPEGGHTWPGGVDVTAGWGTGRLIESVDASALMWEFFSHFTRSNRRGTPRDAS